ncbi:hypothetical protein [Phocaeicola vulgatus]|uniref:hypothetical protein n=1 Tax=Phocaeicola vulgatus TaxID=821 RepID=UPI001F3A8456|nr:hypothetical protein [Phocaeicola vulgatus]MCE8723473.1 hypothetical protein [Phocaeicola vulgatus]
MSMKRTILLTITCMCICLGASAQRNSGRLSLGAGLLYKNGAEMTLAYEHEMNYRHIWEFFANGYLQWSDCRTCGHICPESFWKNYRTWGIGAAYKPCVIRGRNHYGSLRLGASGGSDTHKFVAGIHLGYEHNYVLRSGWTFYWQVKNDVIIRGADLFRTGVALGIKLPIK